MIECKNCHQSVQNSFCPHCGQKTNVGRITLTRLFIDLPHAIFHIDRGLLYNVVQLFKQPGNAINRYIAGSRQPFFHPVTFLIIALILNYLVVKIHNLHFYDESELAGMSVLKAQTIKDYDAMQWWFLEHTYIYISFSIIASTLYLYGIFRLLKQPYNMAETAVVVIFTIAQGVFIQTFVYACTGWVDSGPFLRTVESINIAILISYASLVIYLLLGSVSHTAVRVTYSFIAGFGLAVLWVGMAYVLYLMLT